MNYKNALKNDVIVRETAIINSCNLGSFYKHVSTRLTHKSGVAPLKDRDGVLSLGDLDKANTLNDASISVGTRDNGVFSALADITLSAEFNKVYFEIYDVVRSIMCLKSKSSAGPDGFPPILFKELAYVLAEPLAMLFNLIMQYGQVPSSWKSANVTALFKKGSAADPSNYRPISITCVCSKLFESIIKSHLLTHMYSHKFLSDEQHSFLFRRSTCTKSIRITR